MLNKQDFSTSSQKFFKNDNYRKMLLKSPQNVYTRKWHLNKTTNKELQEMVEVLEKGVLSINPGISIVYSKKRINFKMQFIFFIIIVKTKNIGIEIKTSNGWTKNDYIGLDFAKNIINEVSRHYNVGRKLVLDKVNNE